MCKSSLASSYRDAAIGVLVSKFIHSNRDSTGILMLNIHTSTLRFEGASQLSNLTPIPQSQGCNKSSETDAAKAVRKKPLLGSPCT